MKKDRNTVKKLFSASLILCIFLMLGMISCGPPSLSFEEIVISSDVEKDTNEPVNPKKSFDVNTGQIYATIRYKGAMGKDSWRFRWTNTNTEEIVLDNFQNFSKDQPDSYFEGIIASNIFNTGSSKIIPPGQYRVDFYFNEELKKTTNFTVSNPEMQILDVSIASEIDEKGAPLTLNEEFYPDETVYSCIKFDYLTEGNTIKVVWSSKDNSSINEVSFEINENYYESTYIYFTLPLSENKYNIQPGKYKAEIYFNDDLHGKYDFEVLETDPVTFNELNKYTDESFSFTILIPDNWVYSEEIVEDNLIVYLNPPDNEPAFFAFTEKPAETLKPYEDTAASDIEEIASENNWVLADSKTRTYNLKNGFPVTEVDHLYRDINRNEFIVSYSFTEYEDKVFVYSVVVNRDEYGEVAEEVYYRMLDSLTIK